MKRATKENNIFYKAAAKVRTLERKIAQTEERNTRLYEDYVAGIVDKDDFDTSLYVLSNKDRTFWVSVLLYDNTDILKDCLNKVKD